MAPYRTARRLLPAAVSTERTSSRSTRAGADVVRSIMRKRCEDIHYGVLAASLLVSLTWPVSGNTPLACQSRGGER